MAARRINADATAATLDRSVAGRGTAPGYIRCDNGPELTANALRDWCRFSGTGSSYIEPVNSARIAIQVSARMVIHSGATIAADVLGAESFVGQVCVL